ncbi:MAG: hypothetical protein M1827_000979 [Pycnora praestabilis]|nr:MAG: hypothetical protein M1827_000979 [Pycnora praestabilis]
MSRIRESTQDGIYFAHCPSISRLIPFIVLAYLLLLLPSRTTAYAHGVITSQSSKSLPLKVRDTAIVCFETSPAEWSNGAGARQEMLDDFQNIYGIRDAGVGNWEEGDDSDESTLGLFAPWDTDDHGVEGRTYIKLPKSYEVDARETIPVFVSIPYDDPEDLALIDELIESFNCLATGRADPSQDAYIDRDSLMNFLADIGTGGAHSRKSGDGEVEEGAGGFGSPIYTYLHGYYAKEASDFCPVFKFSRKIVDIAKESLLFGSRKIGGAGGLGWCSFIKDL